MEWLYNSMVPYETGRGGEEYAQAQADESAIETDGQSEFS